MTFNSDNWAGAHPAVFAALLAANDGGMRAYGNDAITARAEALVSEVFETNCAVFFVATGTAANGLSLAALCPPWGAILCGLKAHIAVDESSGPEFFTGGARLVLLDDVAGKLTSSALDDAAARYPRDNIHGAQPRAVSITNATECGTSYTPTEITQLAAVCQREGWGLHVDGARFGNAVAFTGASPAELTWKSGVDVLSFGLTKAGALSAEAIVVFDPEKASDLAIMRKRAGQLFSKHRVLSAQAVGILENGLWLDLAHHTNRLAQRLAAGFSEAGADIIFPVEANEVFARLSFDQFLRLERAGVGFYPWPIEGEGVYRFVVGWPTTEDDVENAVLALH